MSTAVCGTIIKRQFLVLPTSPLIAHPEPRLKCLIIKPQHLQTAGQPPVAKFRRIPPVRRLVPLSRRCSFSRHHSKPWQLLLSLPFCSHYAISGSFNLSFDILFNFRSRYFSSIGLHVIFRFRRNLPPALRCTHKQRDSKRSGDSELPSITKGVSPSLPQFSN